VREKDSERVREAKREREEKSRALYSGGKLNKIIL
jgi:hypothetical protein